ncbi:MAG TPA: hypothetical protein VEJ63_06410 [Planctomycetota bacterium]|nr:hypothetical protein [Planctomycetota bacterium]
MKSIETACAAYEFDFGCYPPDQVTVNGKVLQSSEALAYFLATPFRQSPAMLKDVRATVDVGPYLEITTRHGLDVDGDGAIEIVDVYKEPFEYDNIRDDPNGFTFYGAKDPRQDKKPRNKDSFDIFTPNSSNPGRPLANFKCDWEK